MHVLQQDQVLKHKHYSRVNGQNNCNDLCDFLNF